MKRILCLLMALILCLGLLAGCAAPGEVLMELDGQKITANMYAFWLSRYKAFFVYSYMNNTENLQMWDTVMGDEGKTVNEIFTGYVLDNARTYAAALALYDEYKLSLSAEDKAKISELYPIIYEGVERILSGDIDGAMQMCNSKTSK